MFSYPDLSKGPFSSNVTGRNLESTKLKVSDFH